MKTGELRKEKALCIFQSKYTQSEGTYYYRGDAESGVTTDRTLSCLIYYR